MSDGMLRRYGERFLDEHAAGDYDLGDTSFMADVLHQRRWTDRQRQGFVRTLKRAWVIRFNTGLAP